MVCHGANLIQKITEDLGIYDILRKDTSTSYEIEKYIRHILEQSELEIPDESKQIKREQYAIILNAVKSSNEVVKLRKLLYEKAEDIESKEANKTAFGLSVDKAGFVTLTSLYEGNILSTKYTFIFISPFISMGTIFFLSKRKKSQEDPATNRYSLLFAYQVS